MSDSFNDQAISLTSPLIGGFTITPSDTTDAPHLTRQIRVTGTGGTVAVMWFNGMETIEPVASGETLDWRIRRVRATGTTATGIRGYV